MAFVYHIHLPEHFGAYEEGYIGYTTQTVQERYAEHVQNAFADYSPNYHIHSAIRKNYENLVVTTLVEGSPEYCLLIENRLRPLPNIGWNIAAGGDRGMLGRKHSEATLKKISESLKGRTLSDSTKQKISEVTKGKPKTAEHASKIGDALRGRVRTEDQCVKMREALNATPWNPPRAVPANWSMAQEIADMVLEGVRHKDILEMCGHHKRSSALKHILDRVKAGWIPKEDPAWLQFKEQYLTEQINE
jgi:hypothetical protein